MKDVQWRDIAYINTSAMRIDVIGRILSEGYWESLEDVVNDEFFDEGEGVYRIIIERVTDSDIENAKE